MDTYIIFAVGAVASVATEAFWKGTSRTYVALWGGMGMLLLRRVLLRFPYGNRVLLCLFGALLLFTLWWMLLLVRALPDKGGKTSPAAIPVDVPSFSYGLYRFLLIAPAYAVIEYLEARFGV